MPSAARPNSGRRPGAAPSGESKIVGELEIEVGEGAPLGPVRCERAARAALAAAGVRDGHLAIAFVDRHRMRDLNAAHRGVDAPTDVLSFPIDGPSPTAGPRELGDVVICPEETADIEEAIVHGALHLCGHDHERDRGEMLTLQARALAALRG
jgi:probable rRNA maturation factor